MSAVAQAAATADALFIPDGSDAADLVEALAANRVNVKRLQLLGSGLWADPSVSSAPSLEGAWYPAPDPAGYRNFAARYRKRFNQDPVQTATLAYDAVALVAALVKTHGAQKILGGDPDRSLRLCRRRRRVPFPLRRHQRTRAGGDARHLIWRTAGRAGAALLRVRNLITGA